jgi:hypothetical protein
MLIDMERNGDNEAVAQVLDSAEIPHCLAYTGDPRIGQRHNGLSSAYGNLKKEIDGRDLAAVIGFALSVNNLTPDASHDERVNVFTMALGSIGLIPKIERSSIDRGTTAVIGGQRLQLPLIPDLPAHVCAAWQTSPYTPPLELPSYSPAQQTLDMCYLNE